MKQLFLLLEQFNTKLQKWLPKIYVADAGNYRSGQNIEDHIKRLEEKGEANTRC